MIVTWHSFGRTNEVIKENQGIFVFILRDKWSNSKEGNKGLKSPKHRSESVEIWIRRGLILIVYTLSQYEINGLDNDR